MKGKSMKTLAVTAIACVIISACSVPEAADTQVDNSDIPNFSKVNTVVPGTMFAAIDASVDYQNMLNAAKKACGSEAICKVMIFADDTVLPNQFPMTDREVTLQLGNYTLNRNSGADDLLARCPNVSGTPAEKCMASD